MATTTPRKFGTELTNVQNDLKKQKRGSKAHPNGSENSYKPQATTTATLDQVIQEDTKITPIIAPIAAPKENLINNNAPQMENTKAEERRLRYDIEFMLTLKDQCKEFLEILPEIRREALPPRRIDPPQVRSYSNPNTPYRKPRSTASSSSLLSILASPGAGVIYAPTNDGKYLLSERDQYLLKSFKSATAVTLPIAVVQQPASPSPKYVPPPKKETPAPSVPVEIVTEITVAENAAQEEPEANAEEKMVVMEWKAKKQTKRMKERETDAKRLAARQKQIDIGMNTPGYRAFMATLVDGKSKAEAAKTPDKHQKCSKRSWDGQVRKWRRQLHVYDPPGTVMQEDEDIIFNEEVDSDLEFENSSEEDSISTPDRAKSPQSPNVVLNLETVY